MYNEEYAEPSYRELYSVIFSPDPTKFFELRGIESKASIALPTPRKSEHMTKLSMCETEREWKSELATYRSGACLRLIPKTSSDSRMLGEGDILKSYG